MKSRSILIRNNHAYWQAGGFTLFEVMIVIALFAMLIGLGLFMTMDAYRGYLFRSERDITVGALTEARSRAMANVAQSAYSVCYAAPDFRITGGPGGTEIIAGNSSARVTGFDCGTKSITFAQLAGTTTADITLTVSEPGHTNTDVTVNTEGTIIW